MKKVVEYLKQLGLTEIEANLYQTLLQMGPTTVKDLADRSGVKRITAHFNIESLISKGLVTQTMEGARRKILAEPPDRIESLIQEKQSEILYLKSQFPNILNTIKTHYSSKPSDNEVSIKYYEGKKAVMNIYEDVVKSKELRSYVNCQLLTGIFTTNFDLFTRAHKNRNDMEVWEIMEDSKIARKYADQMSKQRYHYKVTPKNLSLSDSVIDYMMFDGKVAIVDLKSATSGIVISNVNYYNNAKAIFDFIWQILP